MYKVLIVDDEPLIREGLQTIIEWADFGFEVAGSATDGMDALEKFEQLAPDLMIVDVRMPRMDGLRLIRTIQERSGPHPHVLILSGHADFEYARQAMAMRADGYMLKPVDEDELADHLAKLRSLLDEEHRKDEDAKKAGASERDRERILVSLLTSEGKTLQVKSEAVAKAGLDGSSFEVVLVKLLSRKEIDSEITAQVKRRLAEAYEITGSGVVISLDPYIGVVLKNLEVNEGALQVAHRAILQACEDSGLDFVAIRGGSVERLPKLDRSYRNALTGMKGRFVLQGGRVHVWTEASNDLSATDNSAAARPDLNAAREKLLLALDIGNGEAADQLVHDLGASMSAAGWSEQEIKGGFAQLLTTVLGSLVQNRPELKGRSQSFSSEVLGIYAEYRLSGLIERLTELVRGVAEAFRSYGADKQMQKMIELIQRNYQENLKLESLADVFNYNSSYLGKLFKNTTGESFNTYLDKVRIEKAKELLEDGMKVYQVAERVGYSNVDYFHSKFRKYVGASPSSYRRK